MNRLLMKLLKNYQRVDTNVSEQAKYFYFFIFAFLVQHILYTIIKFSFFEIREFDIMLSFILFLVYIVLCLLIYNKKLTSAINIFIIYVLSRSIYITIFTDTLVTYIFLAIFILVISVIHRKSYQYYGMVGIVVGVLITNIGVIFNPTIINLMNSNTLLDTIELSLFLVLFIFLTFILVMIVKQEVLKSKKIQEKATVNFLLMAQKRRGIDHKKEEELVDDLTSVLLVRVDKYDKINDKFGYLIGDKIFKGVIGLIRKTIRVDDYIVRWSFDTFLVVLHYTSLSNAGIVGEKVRFTVEMSNMLSVKEKITVTVSGASTGIENTMQKTIENAEKLLKKKTLTNNSVHLNY